MWRKRFDRFLSLEKAFFDRLGRLSIARAVLKKAEVLILDEATNALGSQTEKLIQEALERVIHEKTVIATTHQLSTIKNADRNIALKAGKLAEQGTLQELLSFEGKFHQAWTTQ
ncbi:hypothetical protein EOM81_12470 [bacterium]|nr:hypothetical protein [bacterium]